jgi:hypothetical protein
VKSRLLIMKLRRLTCSSARFPSVQTAYSLQDSVLKHSIYNLRFE